MSRSIRSIVAYLELDLAIGPSTRPVVSVEASRDGMCLRAFAKARMNGLKREELETVRNIFMGVAPQS